jgi:hypothetical protein
MPRVVDNQKASRSIMVIDMIGDGSFELALKLSLVRQPDNFAVKLNKLEPLESFDEFSNLQARQYGN